jgi:hypothetical protein
LRQRELDRRIAADEPFWIFAIGFCRHSRNQQTLGLEVGDAIVVAIAAGCSSTPAPTFAFCRASPLSIAPSMVLPPV